MGKLTHSPTHDWVKHQLICVLDTADAVHQYSLFQVSREKYTVLAEMQILILK